MIEREESNTIAILRLAHGKANAIDIDMLDALSAQLTRLEKDRDIEAVVVTGSGSIFSAGVDLYRMLEEDQSYTKKFVSELSRVFLRLATFPRPMVAAINGHAIAGGCLLACACDYRLMAAGDGRIGVPELLVGVPFPVVALEIMRQVVSPRYLQDVVYRGGTYHVEVAFQRGLVDEVVGAERLRQSACEVAEKLAAIPAEVFAMTKRQLRQPMLDRVAAYGPKFDAEVAHLWQQPEARTRIRAYMDRIVKKRR